MIAIIEGCGNNVTSLQFALQRLGFASQVTHDVAVIQQASHVILPGVGHAQYAMQQLKAFDLLTLIPQLTQPVLGICLGMQLLYTASQESDTPCLGIIPGQVQRLPARAGYAIPHMGWNRLHYVKGTKASTYVYFVHSYAVPLSDYTVASAEHTETFSAMVKYRNFTGMQFHPERSAQVGETLLKEFLNEG